jgi:hypothetical protein
MRRLIILGILASAACASGGGGTPLFRRDIGTATAVDAVSLAEQVISRHGFEIYQSNPAPDIRILTYWRPREPFADEKALGVNAAESRILVTARERAQTELGALYNVDLTVENRVRVAGTVDWTETHNSEQFRAYANEIASDYKQLVTNIGVRRFSCC